MLASLPTSASASTGELIYLALGLGLVRVLVLAGVGVCMLKVPRCARGVRVGFLRPRCVRGGVRERGWGYGNGWMGWDGMGWGG